MRNRSRARRNAPRQSLLREQRAPAGAWDAHEKQIISYCEIATCARHKLKSGDPSDQTMALSERAAPPSPAGPQPRRARLLRPVQAGAPARIGPAGCAVLLQTRFDRRLDCCPSGDFGGEEGCAADRASVMLEPPLGGGSGERHVQRMPGSGRRDPLTSAYAGRTSQFHNTK